MLDMVTTINRAVFPFGGGMRKFIPFMLHAMQEAVPRPSWDGCNYHDLTCGSCSGSATFALNGMNVTANDLSLRSYIAAQGLFSTIRLPPKLLPPLVEKAASDQPLAPVPSDTIRSGFIHPDACRVFDALYFAGDRGDVPQEHAPMARYLALRWLCIQRPFTYYLKHPAGPLKTWYLQGPGWAKIAAQAMNPLPFLFKLLAGIDLYQKSLPSHVTARVTRGDCREIVRDLDFSRPSIVALNPPTDGNVRFMSSNRLLDSLLHNQKLPIEKDDLPPDDLWRSLVFDTARHIPAGHFLFGFAGDGATPWEVARPMFDGIGTVIAEWPAPWRDSDKIAGPLLVRIGA